MGNITFKVKIWHPNLLYTEFEFSDILEALKKLRQLRNEHSPVYVVDLRVMKNGRVVEILELV